MKMNDATVQELMFNMKSIHTDRFKPPDKGQRLLNSRLQSAEREEMRTVTRPRAHSLTRGKWLCNRGIQWNMHGNGLVGEGEDDTIDIFVRSLVVRKKAAESIRDKAGDPKLRNVDLLV